MLGFVGPGPTPSIPSRLAVQTPSPKVSNVAGPEREINNPNLRRNNRKNSRRRRRKIRCANRRHHRQRFCLGCCPFYRRRLGLGLNLGRDDGARCYYSLSLRFGLRLVCCRGSGLSVLPRNAFGLPSRIDCDCEVQRCCLHRPRVGSTW